ncbi:hypothetical protein KY284_030898 [Solanum tuberosum]|nr:hypothetical protein KY284_030898 [Solanum tuberosum]
MQIGNGIRSFHVFSFCITLHNQAECSCKSCCPIETSNKEAARDPESEREEEVQDCRRRRVNK